MDDCYPDNPCTNYPDLFADWCEQCKTQQRATVCVVTYGDNAYTDEFCSVYVTLEAARVGLGVVEWERIEVGTGENVSVWYEGTAYEHHGEGDDSYSIGHKYRAKIEDVQIPTERKV